MSRKPIRKAVFPVAGLGTRFLPATKVVPKELLPMVDRPLIQYAVDEAREAGIEQMIFVTGRGKTGIVEHFDIAFELEQTMTERGKDLSVLDCTRAIPGDLIAVRQQVPLGLGHAIWCARAIIGDEPFAIFLPDELMVAREGGTGCMKQMVEAYNEVGGNLISVLEVPIEQVSAYGVIDPGAAKGALTESLRAVRKTPGGRSTFEQDRLGPIYLATRSDASARKSGQGCWRRNPADRAGGRSPGRYHSTPRADPAPRLKFTSKYAHGGAGQLPIRARMRKKKLRAPSYPSATGPAGLIRTRRTLGSNSPLGT